MSKARMRWLMAGIISVLIMSSFMIYRIILDRTVNEANLENYQKNQMYSNAVGRFYNMIEESKQRAAVWIYDPTNFENKTALVDLKEIECKSLNFNLELIANSTDGVDFNQIKKLLVEFDTLLAWQEKKIILPLQTKTDYDDPVILTRAQISLKSDIVEGADSLMAKVELLGDELEEHSSQLRDEADARRYRGSFVLSVLAVLMFLAGLIGMMIVIYSPGWTAKSGA